MSEETKVEKTEKPSSKKFAVIRIRGLVGLKKPIKDTLTMLGLHRRNYCTLVDRKDLGMIKKVKDYVTYGELDKATEDLLIKEKQETMKNKEGKDVPKKFFRLCPPKKGFERKHSRKLPIPA